MVPIRKLPVESDAKKFWVSQIGDWDCWLASLCIALNYWEIGANYKSLLSFLVGSGLKISEDYGAYITYAALILSDLDFFINVKAPINLLPELRLLLKKEAQKVFLSQINCDLLETLSMELKKAEYPSYPRHFLYKSLSLLQRKSYLGDVQFHCFEHSPSFSDISSSIGMGLPVLVFVSSSEFYGIPNDSSGHIVVFIPVSDNKKGYIILDAYSELGYSYSKNWKKYLVTSQSFNWNNWSNWMIALAPNHVHFDRNKKD